MTASEIIKILKNKGLRIKYYKNGSDEIAIQGEVDSVDVNWLADQKKKLKDFIENALEYATNFNIHSVTDQEDYPISYSQRRLLILHEASPLSTAYNIPFLHVINKHLDPDKFAVAFEQLIYRHESLRTSFHFFNGEYRQKVHSSIKHNWFEYTDVRGKAHANQIAQVILDASRNKIFDLSASPLITVKLICIADDVWVLFINIHHIICDGWSINILFSELMLLYEANTSNKKNVLAPLAVQYKDYAVWEQKQIHSSGINIHREYWKNKFKDELPFLNFPITDYTVSSTRGGLFNFTLDSTTTQRLKEIGDREGCSLFMILMMIFKVLLYHYFKEPDIVVGSALAGRDDVRIQNLIGFFIRTLAFRTKLDEQDTFKDALKKVQQTILEGYEHQIYPFDLLIEDLNLENTNQKTNPLFETMLVLQNQEQVSELSQKNNRGNDDFDAVEIEAKFDLLLNFQEIPDGLTASIEYRKNKFDSYGIKQIAHLFINLVNGFIGNQKLKIGSVDFLETDERTALIENFNRTAQKYPDAKNIVSLFQDQVAKTPDKIAIVCRQEHITYRQLFEASRNLANYLIKNVGVQPGDIIAFMAERNVQMIINMLAILRAGAAYVPVDPSYPNERKDYIIADSGCELMLISGKVGNWRPQKSIKTIVTDELIPNFQNEPSVFFQSPINSSSLAYLIYTSGSTGLPKGVEVSHSNVANLLQWASDFHTSEELSGLFAATSVCFDLSVYEIFLPLVNGGTMILADNVLELQTYEGAVPIRLINSVPSAVNELLRLKAVPSSVTTINLAGEALSRELVNRLYSLDHIERVNNLYGPSETTTYSTFEQVDKNLTQAISIGRPIANTRIYIMDESLKLSPIGIYGEIYIAGAGVAMGYHKKPELTAAHFLKNPLNEEEIIYKTGDIGKWLPDGRIQLAGRKDDQVKIRGYRIELGEINYLLQKHPAVLESVVLAQSDEEGSKFLVGYIVSVENDNVTLTTTIKQYLGKHLPAYMIPEYFVILDQMPLTTNGKIDKKRLSLVDTVDRATAYEEITYTEHERTIATLWEEILGRKGIKPNDDFFMTGGHSLKATRLVSKIHEKTGVNISLRTFFDHPTIAALALKINNGVEKLNYSENIKLLPFQDYYELSHGQKQLWLLGQTKKGLLAYNMPYVFILNGNLDYAAMYKVAFTLLERHESLRTSFPVIDGQPFQRIHPLASLTFQPEELDISGRPNIEEVIMHLHREEAQRDFDLMKAPLVHVKLVRITPQMHVLFFTIHHIICDAWSLEVLKEEATLLYNAFTNNKTNPLKPLRIQYKEFAAWQNSLLGADMFEEHRKYWVDKFLNSGPLLELPFDQPAISEKTFKGKSKFFHFDETISRSIKDFTLRHGITEFMFFLSVVKLLFYYYTKRTDITIGTAVSGRDYADLESQIGYYLNTLPIKTEFNNEESYIRFIGLVKKNVQEAFLYKLYPFDYLIEELPLASEKETALFNILLVEIQDSQTSKVVKEQVQNVEKGQKERNNSSNESFFTKFDLIFSFYEYKEIINASVEYATDHFSENRIDKFIADLNKVLLAVITNPAAPINNLDLISNDEYNQLVYKFGQPEEEVIPVFNPGSLIEMHAHQNPEKIVIISAQEKISYHHLNENADQIAQFISNIEQHGPIETIVILTDDKTLMVTLALSSMKAGKTFVYLSPSMQEKTLCKIINDAKATLMISPVKSGRIANRLLWSCKSLRYLWFAGSKNFFGELEEGGSIVNQDFWNNLNDDQEQDDILGGAWIRSDNGQAFSRNEMNEYAENTRQKLLPYLNNDTKVIEIGCATGITLRAIAPIVKEYHGTDLSEKVLHITRKLIRKDKMKNVILRSLEAKDMDQYPEKDFDIVIINSTINHFPGHNYLKHVIRTSINLIKDKGYLFIGDVMDEELRYQLEEEMTLIKERNLMHGAFTRNDFSRELFIGKSYWSDLEHDLVEISKIEITGKIHTIENELTKYRYDVILSIDKHKTLCTAPRRFKYQFDDSCLPKHGTTFKSITSEDNHIAFIRYSAVENGSFIKNSISNQAIVNAINRLEKDILSSNDEVLAEDPEMSLALLLKGSSICLPPKKPYSDTTALLNHIEDFAIKSLFISPDQFSLLLDNLEQNKTSLKLSQLKSILVIGHGLTLQQWSRGIEILQQKKHLISLQHLFSLPETFFAISCYIASDEVNPLAGTPAGRLLQNNIAYILDKELKPTPIDLDGDLYITGVNLCVLQGDGEFSTNFIPDPFHNGRQIYKSGMRARWNKDGILFITGHNKDFTGSWYKSITEMELQLKASGLIEDVIISSLTNTNKKKLIGYYSGGNQINSNILKSFLSSRFFNAFVPDEYQQLDAIPYNLDGFPDFNAIKIPSIQPGTEIEKRIAEIWTEVLGKEQNNINRNFFEIGGNSITALKLVTRINKAFKTPLLITDIFESPTIANQALLINNSNTSEKQEVIENIESRDLYEISHSQKRLFILQQSEENAIAYNMLDFIPIPQEISDEILHKALKIVIERHESLRTIFVQSGSEVMQRILPAFNVSDHFEIIDLSNLTHWQEDLKKNVDSEKSYLFNLAKGPLTRFKVFRLPRGNQDFICFACHHIICDGWSMQVLRRDLHAILYALTQDKPILLSPLKLQYRDFAAWQNSQISGSQMQTHKEYWMSQFAGEIPRLAFPTDYSRPLTRTANGNNYSFSIKREDWLQFKEILVRNDCTIFMGLYATLNALFYRYTKQNDIIIGSVIAGRDHIDLEDQVGFYVQTLALRSRPHSNCTFFDLLDMAKKTVLGAFHHQSFPFDLLIEALNLPHDPSHTPLFDIIFVFQNTSEAFQTNKSATEQPIEGFDGPVNTKFDLSFSFEEDADYLNCRLEFNTSLFKNETIILLAGHLKSLLSAIVTVPQQKIGELSFVSNNEMELIKTMNSNVSDEESLATPLDLFYRQVLRCPEKTAIIFGQTTLTYQELNERSNQLATYLLKHFSVQPGQKIGMLVSRTEKMVISVLSILKLNAIYVPIDPQLPGERIRLLAEDINMDLLITETGIASEKYPPSVVACQLDKIWNVVEQEPIHELGIPIRCTDIAYVIFTSGSTGRPKGVMIEHGSITNLMIWARKQFDPNGNEIVVVATTVSFDLSIFEILYPLGSGSTLFVMAGILDLIISDDNTGITQIFGVPSSLKELMNENSIPSSVKLIGIGGEPLKRELVDGLYKLPHVDRIFNLYGPTETTVMSTFKLMDRGDFSDPAIGNPIRNTQIYILDENKQIVPFGVVGEIYIAGKGVAKGYMNMPEITAKSFVKDPFGNGACYKTGDLGKWITNGDIKYEGRADDQVKIRGYRIELGEIENQLLTIEKITEAFVFLTEGSENTRTLVASLVGPKLTDLNHIGRQLDQKLPTYMIPSSFILVDKFPLTPAGKIDRKALLSMERHHPITPDRELMPRNEIEKTLVSAWKKVLALEKVGLYDDFFRNGGHSISAIRLMALINEELNIQLPFKLLFELRTVAALALEIEAIQWVNKSETEWVEDVLEKII